jgi:hypothetical protein
MDDGRLSSQEAADLCGVAYRSVWRMVRRSDQARTTGRPVGVIAGARQSNWFAMFRRWLPRIERLRRSIALLSPGQPAGLSREDAIALLADLREARRELERLTAGLRQLLNSTWREGS